MAVRALSGHDFRRRHTSLVDKHDDALCRFCKKELETPSHIILQCPMLIHHRALTFHSYTADISQIWTADTLVDFLSAQHIAEMETSMTR